MRKPTLGHRIQHLGYRVALRALSLAPEGLAHWVGGVMGWTAGMVLGVRRRVALEHIRSAFPRKAPAWHRKILADSYRHLGRESLATFLLPKLSAADIKARVATDPDQLAAFRRAVEEGKGVILVSAHFGNWELGGALMAALGFPMDVVAQRQRNPLFDADINRTRTRLGMTVILRGEAPRKVLRSLKRGRVVALVADQNIRRGGVFVDFFGRPASTARGAAIFALRTGSPIFLGLLRREKVSLPGYCLSLVPVEFRPSGDQEEDVRRITEAHTRHLEETIRKAPEQYLWQHRRWKTRPPEETDGRS